MLKPWRYVAAVVGAVLLIQVAWIAVMPPFRGVDEFDHAFRAVAVADGQWEAGGWATDGRGRLVTVPRALVTAAHAQCAALPYTGHDNCYPAKSLPGGKVEVASSAAGYEPVFYWIVGTPARPFSGAGSLYAMRVATALLSTFFIALGVWALTTTRRRSARWVGAVLPLALTPVLLYSTTVVAPNGPEMGAALALWCALVAWIHGRPDPRTERGIVVVIAVSGIALAGLRELGPEYLFLIVLVVAAVDPRAFRDVLVRRWRQLVAPVGAAVAVGLAGLLWRHHQAGIGPALVPDVKVGMTASNVIAWPLQVVAAFPFRDQSAPAVVYVLSVGLFLALVVVALRRAAGWQRIVLALFLVGSFALPFVLTAATYSSRGVIWQGRYGLPIFVGLPVVCALVAGRTGAAPSRWLLGVVAALLGIANVAGPLRVLHDERHRAASTNDGAWHQPSAVLVAFVILAAFAMWGWAIAAREGAGADAA
ncbi:MAG TPA: DUF2142 domain-containing protein [Marmoricola sp.]|nr:DUF2142 domain-containing protein [Marmoricola sp.]